MGKERYIVQKLSRDCLFPETLCELKDTESDFFIILENIDDANKIKNIFNQKDTQIKELEQENQQLKQAQKQLAISELEKLKTELVNKVSPVLLSYTDYVQQVYTKIDDKIKELKEGVK